MCQTIDELVRQYPGLQPYLLLSSESLQRIADGEDLPLFELNQFRGRRRMAPLLKLIAFKRQAEFVEIELAKIVKM